MRRSRLGGSTKALTEGRLDEKLKLYTVPRLLIVDEIGYLPARLRAAGGLRDADWQHILREIPAALRFLAGPNPTVTRNEHGQLVLNPDADPRNADWIRLAAAARKAHHHLPRWAAMWLWQVGHTRGARFWEGVARIAEQMHWPKSEPDPA